MQYRILGPLEVIDGDRVVDVGSPKQRALLASLVIRPNEVVSLDRLIEELWGEEAPAQATGSLQAYVSNLRRVLEPDRAPRAPATVLVTQPPGYALRVAPDDVDARCFEVLAAEAGRLLLDGDPAGALEVVERALSLWRGAPLADFVFEAFAQGEIARLEDLRLAAVEVSLEAGLALGRHTAAVPELEQLVTEHPLRERLSGLLMLALYRAGRQAEALRVYRATRERLADELGLEPGPALQRLEADVLRQAPELDWRPTPAPARAPAGTEPAQPAPVITAAPPAARRGHDVAATAPGSALVGRDTELAMLQAALDDARAWRSGLVLVGGEPGIGKTRLVEELAGRADAAGFAVAFGRCYEGDGAPAFWPWLQVLRGLVDRLGPDGAQAALGAGAAELLPLLPELAAAVGAPVASPPSDPSGARFQLYEAATRFLQRASDAAPLVVVIDDLQWADVSSLKLLQFLAGDQSAARLLVVAAYRDTDVLPAHPLGDCLAALARHASVSRLELAGLAADDVRRYVEHTTGGEVDDDVTTRIADAVHRRADGNPFFIGELVRLLASEGRLMTADVETGAVPAGVRDVIRLRLARLPADAQTLLVLAAVAGRTFTLDVLERASGLDGDRVLDLVEAALINRIVVETGDYGTYRFANGLVRETLYDSITAVRRARLHGRVGAALEEAWQADLDAHLSELAHHFGQAAATGQASKAVAYARRAAEQADAQLAYEEAACHWQRALSALELDATGDRETRYHVLVGLGEARRRLLDIPGMRDALEAAVEVAVAMGDPERVARAALALGGASVWSWRGYGVVDADAVAVLERTLELLGPDDSAHRSHVLGNLAVEHYYTDVVARDALSASSVAMARRLGGGPRVLIPALYTRYVSCWSAGAVDERLALADEIIALAEGLDRRFEAIGRFFRMVALTELGDLQAADVELEGCSGISAELRLPVPIAQIAAHHTMRACLAGSFDAAEQLATVALELRERTTWRGALDACTAQLFMVRWHQGRLDELEAVLTDLAERRPMPGFPEALAIAHLEAGRLVEARATAGGMAAPADDWWWLYTSCLQAEVVARLGDVPACERLYGALLPHAAMVSVAGGVTTAAGGVHHFLGRLAAAMGRADDAAAHFDAAVGQALRLGMRPWLVRSRLAYAAVLDERDGPDDAGLAERLRAEAGAVALEIGMPVGVEPAVC